MKSDLIVTTTCMDTSGDFVAARSRRTNAVASSRRSASVAGSRLPWIQGSQTGTTPRTDRRAAAPLPSGCRGINANASAMPELDLVRTRSKRSAQACRRPPLSPVRSAKASANFLTGASAGCISIQFQGRSWTFASLGRRPALIREDLPDPEPPTMATKCLSVT